MAANHHQRLSRHRVSVAPLLAGILLTAGCVTFSDAPLNTVPEPEAHEQSTAHGWIPVVRYGRYTLVELTPAVAQQDLLLQIIDLSMPESLRATVGDALREVLLRSGYTLCDTNPEATALYDLPLPAAHFRLGPLMLRDALITLAGSAWDLQVDGITRQVCFTKQLETPP